MVEEEVLHPGADLEEAEAGIAQRKEMEEGIETDPTKPKQKKLNMIHTHMEAPICPRSNSYRSNFPEGTKGLQAKK